jgi:sugar phosphate isomerase/epimerase
MADNYEYFYQGAVSSLQPEYGELFAGYRIPAERISAPTSPQTADQIREVSSRLSEGMKGVELSTIREEFFEAIPKQHMKEINRLAKLTGSKISLHAPIIDPAGFTQEGWSEVEREKVEQRLWNIVERSHELDPNGNVPVNIHATAMPAAEFTALTTPEAKETYEGLIKQGYPEKEAAKIAEKSMIAAVNQATGRVTAVKREKEYYPGKEGYVIMTPQEKIKVINDTEWQNSLMPALEHAKAAEDRLNDAGQLILLKLKKGEQLGPEDEVPLANLQKAEFLINHAYSEARTLYDNAYKYGDERTKKELERFSRQFKEEIKKAKTPGGRLSLLNKLLSQLDRINPPKIYQPLEEFALTKAGKTFGDVALKAFEKYGYKAPLIAIENVFPEMAFSRAEELKKLIERSREEFVKGAVKKGYSRDEAKEAAKKLIGATWDVGHINILRKSGFGKKKIIEETKKIAPYVKHVHLTDNFGYGDSHLPPGMGEVPTKEMLKELEKAGFSGRLIAEAGGLVQHFKASPHPYVLEAMGSPIYAAYMQPFWNQARVSYGSYFIGYGTMLPDQHFSMYGAGFSTLPTELGGQVPGKKSRLTGTPME